MAESTKETKKSNTWLIVSVLFLIWAVGASVGAAYYYQISTEQARQISDLESIVDATTIKVNIAINYGNGTTVWFNNTIVPIGYPLLNSTQKVANVQYQTSSMGIFVTSINGVSQNTAESKYWVYDGYINGNWEPIWVGAAEYQMHNNETIMWSLKQF